MRPSGNIRRRILNGDITESSRVEHGFIRPFKKEKGGGGSPKHLVTILLIYAIIFCIICDPQHHTSNPVSALKPDMDQQFSYDSHHREKHLAQPLKAGYVWWNLKRRPDGFWALTQPPTQLPDASSRQHSPMDTEYLKMWIPPPSDVPSPLFSSLSNAFSITFHFPRQRNPFKSQRLNALLLLIMSSSEISNFNHGRNDL